MSLFLQDTEPSSWLELLDLFFANCEDLGQNSGKLLLACSGGLDSMVLLSIASDYAKRKGHVLELLHVNYGLRGEESDGDAAFVQNEGLRLGLKVHTLKAEANPKTGVGVQNWARQIRYEWFHQLAGPHDRILLAHHRDDLIETILMRVVRGSSLQGLMGMKSREGPFFRPLLDCSRLAIAAFAHEHDITYREDSSNASLDYSRNRLRHMILPELEAMFPGARHNLLELARSGQEWTRFFYQAMENRAAPDSPAEWKEFGFYPASQFILSELESFLNEEFSATKPSRPWLESLYGTLCSGLSAILQLDGHVQVEVQRGRFRFERVLSGEKASARWLQYQRELTKSGLASSLSPGARLDVELDDVMEMQDTKILRTSPK